MNKENRPRKKCTESGKALHTGLQHRGSLHDPTLALNAHMCRGFHFRHLREKQHQLMSKETHIMKIIGLEFQKPPVQSLLYFRKTGLHLISLELDLN